MSIRKHVGLHDVPKINTAEKSTINPVPLQSKNVIVASRYRLLLLAGLVILLRVPFLNQAVAGDEPYYLAAAYHALVDPWHPNHIWYVFEGRDVTFQGYPHPPGNAWVLAALLAVFGDVREVPFHVAYIAFSLIAVCGMYALARRFSPSPFWATALFVVTPTFLVNGNLLESDVPLVAFWLAGAAAFIYGVDRKNPRLLALAAVALSGAALIAMQSVLFSPILLLYLLARRERWSVARVAVACAPILMLAAWQVFERVTSGVFPAAVSAGYLSSYGHERLAMKLRNATGLTVHALFIVFPIVLPFAVRAVWRHQQDRDARFLAGWIGVFLTGAWVLFYAGSARYLLPMAAPVAILATRAPLRWVRAAVGIQLAISLGLAVVNYQHWDSYRHFAAALAKQTQGKRVWVDAEWGLRHYLEANGALPLHRDQWIPTGDIVVESALAYPAPYGHGGRTLVSVAEMEIHPWLPLRLIGIDSGSGYSTAGEGFLPWDFRGGAIDRVRASILRENAPTLSQLPMNAPEADRQIVYGIWPLEGGAWRWMSGEAVVSLKSTEAKSVLRVKFFIADSVPARVMHVAIVNGPEKSQMFPGPGSYELNMPVDALQSTPVTVKISVDRTFQPPGDSRRLGVILNEIALSPLK